MWGVRVVGLLSYGGRTKALEGPATDAPSTVWRWRQEEEWGGVVQLSSKQTLQGVYWEVTSGSTVREESSETGKGGKSLPFFKWPHQGASMVGNWDSTQSETMWVADHSSGTNSLALLAKYTRLALLSRGQRIPWVRERQTVTDWSWNLLQATLVEVCRLEGSWQETYRPSEGTSGGSTHCGELASGQHGVPSWLARATVSVCTLLSGGTRRKS